MAAQLIAAHNAAMECYRRAMHGEQTFEGRRENLAQANKLSRTYATIYQLSMCRSRRYRAAHTYARIKKSCSCRLLNCTSCKVTVLFASNLMTVSAPTCWLASKTAWGVANTALSN